MKHKCYVTYENFIESLVPSASIFSDVNSLLGNVNFESVLNFTDEDLELFFRDIYGDRLVAFPVEVIGDEPSDTFVFVKLKRLVKYTLLSNKPKYLAALKMYTADYKPDVNNFVDEKESTGLKVDDTKVTSTPSGAVKTTSPYITKTDQQNKTTTFDSDTARLNNQSIVDTTWANAGETRTSYENYKTESKNEPTNSKTSALGQDFNVGNNNQVVDRVLHKEGNIGTRSTQELWTQEIELKAFNIIEEFLNDVKEQVLLSVY